MDLNGTLAEAVRNYRCGLEAEGNKSFARLTELLSALFAAKPELALRPELSQILKQCMNAQTRADYLWLADLLEYELAAIVGSGPDDGQ